MIDVHRLPIAGLLASYAEPGDAGAGSLPVVIGLVVLLAIVAVRVRGRELRPRRLLIVPVILLVLGAGAVALQLLRHTDLHTVDYVVAAVDVVLSVGLGAARGFTVRIYPNGGTTWYRYGPATVLLWCLSIALRFALGLYGSRYGATPLITSADVLFLLGITLLVQNTIVVTRRPTGVQSPVV